MEHENKSVNEISHIFWISCPDDYSAYILEYALQEVMKIKEKGVKTHNRIWSPGKRYYETLKMLKKGE